MPTLAIPIRSLANPRQVSSGARTPFVYTIPLSSPNRYTFLTHANTLPADNNHPQEYHQPHQTNDGPGLPILREGRETVDHLPTEIKDILVFKGETETNRGGVFTRGCEAETKTGGWERGDFVQERRSQGILCTKN